MFPPIDKVQEQMKLWFQSAMKSEAEVVRKAGFEKEAVLLETFCDDSFFINMNNMLSGSMKNAIIGHGDAWTNNMLFLYDEAGEKLKSLKFVDFQLTRCG